MSVPPAEPFSDAKAVAGYRSGPPRQVPGYAELCERAGTLLAARAGRQAQMLVVGAGGGLEIEAMAGAQPGWRFVGVDPSRAMLDLAAAHLTQIAERVELVEGTVHAAPAGPFDGATCLLTMHFVPISEKLSTLAAIHARLTPGAAFVLAHHSVDPATVDGRAALAASVAFATDLDPASAQVAERVQLMCDRLALQSPADDAAALHAAGFVAVREFWHAHSFRGWVAHA